MAGAGKGVEVTIRNLDTGRVDTYQGMAVQMSIKPNPESWPMFVMRGGTRGDHVICLASTMHYLGLLHPETYARACMLRDSGKLPIPQQIGPQQELKS